MTWTFPLDGREHTSDYCPTLDFSKYAMYAAAAQVAIGLLISVVGYSAGAAWDTLYVL
jgi:hypothetical protein